MSLRSLFPCPSCQKRGSSYIQANTVISSPPLQFVCVCVYWLCNQSVCLYVSHTGVCVSVERLQGVQHTIHQSELAAEAHADPQRGQAIQGEHARTHNSPVSHESEYLLTTWTTCNFSQPEIALHHVSWLRMVCVPAVCGGGLQRHVCLSGRAGPSRPHSLQLTEFIQSVQSGQSQGGVSIQGRPQQEEETEEQTKTLATYVQTHTCLSVRIASRCSI